MQLVLAKAVKTTYAYKVIGCLSALMERVPSSSIVNNCILDGFNGTVGSLRCWTNLIVLMNPNTNKLP